MKLEKLRSIRDSHRRAITIRFGELEEAKEESTLLKCKTILRNIEERSETLKSLDEKILEATEVADVDEEVLGTEAFSIKLRIQIDEWKEYMRNQVELRSNVSNNRSDELAEPQVDGHVQVDDVRDQGTAEQGLSTDILQVSSLPQQTVSRSSTYNNQSHKLPKLTLPSFSGNLLEWQNFWDSYETAVHCNPTLSEVQKFNYLKSLVEGDAARAISGFAMSNTNYVNAVDLLKERFGNTSKLIQAQIQALLQLPAPSSSLYSLRDFYDKLESYVRSLESLGQNQDNYGGILVPIIIGKLPSEIRRNLARVNESDSWNLSDLRKAIRRELKILEAGEDGVTLTSTKPLQPTASFYTGVSSKRRKTETKPTHQQTGAAKAQAKCVFCDGDHFPNNCLQVRDYKSRVQIVKTKGLCFNCLRPHQVYNCTSKFRCRTCKRKHHSSICSKTETTNTTPAHQAQTSDLVPTPYRPSHSQSDVPVARNQPQQPTTSILHTTTCQYKPGVLLKTAVAPISSETQTLDANILFDEGSQRSFVTEELADKLQLTRTGSEVINLASFGGSTQTANSLDTATVTLTTISNERINLQVLIVPRIAAPLSNRTHKEAVNLPYLKGLTLAYHVTTDDMFEISVLIGADHYWEIVQNTVIRGDGPTAVSSKLGFLLSGPLPVSTTHTEHGHVMNVIISPPPTCDLERFWKLESLGVEDQVDVSSKTDRLSTYKQNCISFQQDRYVARLPWRSNHDTLPTNYDITLRRTENTIKRLSKEPDMLQKYGEIIADQEKRGFIEKVNDHEESRNVHYIPHHAVKKDSLTTPIRIVYDCSCKQSKDQTSLNECLESTPPELNNITSILLRFRQHEYGITTDIEKAFLHVGLDEVDRDYTRFLWLSNPTDPNSKLQTYRFKAVLFGATCSPFILNATILKHLEHNESWVSSLLTDNLYVDNILTSLPNEDQILDFFTESRAIMSTASFNLRSWTSNSPKLREKAETMHVLDKDPVTKVLGLRWNPITDVLQFARPAISAEVCTKREILKQTSRLYDPLGILSPVTVRAKLLLQDLWRHNYTWDTPLSDEIRSKWVDLASDLNAVTNTQLERFYFRESRPEPNCIESTAVKLHVFVDASKQAYGAVAYLCSQLQSTLMIAKNRVSPLKSITLPKLELMAAVTGARLAKHVQESLPVTDVYFWSDSQIVLYWIKSEKPVNRFVDNRVRQIRSLTNNSSWCYCPTKENPADLQTRGLSAHQFAASKLWRNGPHWLLHQPSWPIWIPESTNILTTTTDETTNTQTPMQPLNSTGILMVVDAQRYSTYPKLLRVIAYIQRFIQYCKSTVEHRQYGPVTAEELRMAEVNLLRSAQEEVYSEVVNVVASERSNSKRHTIVRQLHLYLDNDRLLRSDGRIHNAPVDYQTKFPILLPPKHRVTDLIIQEAHNTILHSGENATISQIRRKYWIPQIRQCVKSVLRTCVTCKKVISRPYLPPETPPLTKYRVEDSDPFTVTGVDFTGALQVKPGDRRNTKAYICLFTCAATRAIHLEVVPDMTEDSFLLAFRRFTSRRSLPKLMVSDNATTFQAAANELRRLTNSTKIHEQLGRKGTEWKFIPKAAPWFGGWWERLIGLTKTCLKKSLGRATITYEELQTIVAEVESVLNDRPITYVSSNNEEPEPLTPSLLLYGRNITKLPYQQPPIHNVAIETNRSTITRRAKTMQNALSHFRERWKYEYLTSLRERQQTKQNTCNAQSIKPGDVVQIHDNKPRVLWKLAVVDEVVRGRDNLIRSAKLRTKDGMTNRPITKLYPLEVTLETANSDHDNT